MNIISKILVTVGLILFFICPIYQTIDCGIKNIPGDGVIVFGDNPVFKNILGVRTDHYFMISGEGWEYSGTEIKTPTWMQKMGFENKEHNSDFGYYESKSGSSTDKYYLLVMLRWFIKLIPLYLIILAEILEQVNIKYVKKT